jgi:hypothetical protein
MSDTTYQPPQPPVDPNTQPGMLGISPNAWAQIASLGAGMLQGANARTADGHLANGTGFAGAFGVGAGDMLQTARQQRQDQSQRNYQGLQTQNLLLDNQLKTATMPAQIARSRAQLQFQQQFLSDPNAMSGGTPPAPAAGGGQIYTSNGQQYSTDPNAYGGGYAQAVEKLEGTGQNPNSTASGIGQLTQANKDAFANDHPEIFGNVSPDQRNQLFATPAVGRTAINYMGLHNTMALTNSGVAPTGPNLALAHNIGPIPAAAIVNADAGAPVGPIFQRVLSPDQYKSYMTANPQFASMSAGDLRGRFASVPNLDINDPHVNEPAAHPQQQQGGGQQPQQQPGPATGTLPAGMSPQEAMGRSQQAATMAMRAQAAGMDATPYTQQAQNYQQYAQNYWLQQSKPQSIRGEGGGIITPNGPIQSPVVRNVLGPDNREWMISQNTIESGQPYQRPAGVPSWAPPGTLSAVPSKLSPGETTAQTDAAGDAFGEKARSQYASAVGTVRAMEDMDRQFQVLNASPGGFNTGAGATWKLDFAKAVNSGMQSAGAAPFFDVNKLAAGEDLQKQTKLAGMQALQSMFGGSREAASIVQSTQGAVPSVENTPLGGKLVMNGIKEAARWQMDQHAFNTQWYQDHKGNMVGADVAFQQQRPSQMYTLRGISQVQPYPVTSPSDFRRYLPGTQVYLKGDPSKIKVIPGNEDVTVSQ